MHPEDCVQRDPSAFFEVCVHCESDPADSAHEELAEIFRLNPNMKWQSGEK